MRDFLFKTTRFIQDTETQIILQTIITLDKFQRKIERNYIKLQKVAADVGGIIKFFSLIFSFLATEYSKIRFYDHMIRFITNEANVANSNLNTLNKIRIPIIKKSKILLNRNNNNNISESKLYELEKSEKIYLKKSNSLPSKSVLENIIHKNFDVVQNNNFVNASKKTINCNIEYFENNKEKVNLNINQAHFISPVDTSSLENYRLSNSFFIRRYFKCLKNNNVKFLNHFKNYFENFFTIENLLKKNNENEEFKNTLLTENEKNNILIKTSLKTFSNVFKL